MQRRLLLLHAVLSVSLAPAAGHAIENAAIRTVVVQSQQGGSGQTSVDAVVEAVREATLSAQVAGAVVALHVKAGDRVRAGQALVRIDARAAQQQVAGSTAQMQAAQAALNVATRELERQKQLFQKQYISQGALDRAQGEWETAQAQVQALQAQTQAAQTQSGFFVIQAPFNGVVSEVPVALGDMAMPGKPLLTLHDPSALRITASVPQALLAGVGAQLQSVRYEIPGVASAQSAHIQLLPTVDRGTHSAQLRVGLGADLKGLVPGMFARVWLPVAGSNAGASDKGAEKIELPAQTLVRRAEVTGVYVLDAQNKPRLRQVRIGARQGDKVEILTGVAVGDQVVLDPTTLPPTR